jgi:hypothetical protein
MLGETIEQPCTYVLAHTPEVCKGAHLYSEYPASQDDHDSWGECVQPLQSVNCLDSRAHGHERHGSLHD